MAVIFNNCSSWLINTLHTPPPKLSRLRGRTISAMDIHNSNFMEFPYVSVPHKNIMVDLVSTVEDRLGSQLLPCTLPHDVRSFRNHNGTAHASLHIRSGLDSSPIDFFVASWINCELPTGAALNITSLSAFLNSSTDAPNFLMEIIRSSPTSIVLVLDLLPRMDLVLYPDYLKTFYEETKLESKRTELEKLPEAKPYFFSSLYLRSVVSPTAIMVGIEAEDANRLEEILEDHVGPVVKEVSGMWLDQCGYGGRVVGEAERDYLRKRGKIMKAKTIENDLALNLPKLFGEETAGRVLAAVGEYF